MVSLVGQLNALCQEGPGHRALEAPQEGQAPQHLSLRGETLRLPVNTYPNTMS